MARGSIVRVHVALQLTYLAFRRETRCGKWSSSNGWATHDEIRVCCSAGLTSLFSPFIEIVGQEGKTETETSRRLRLDRDFQTHHLHKGCDFTCSRLHTFCFPSCRIKDDFMIGGFYLLWIRVSENEPRKCQRRADGSHVFGGRTLVFTL